MPTKVTSPSPAEIEEVTGIFLAEKAQFCLVTQVAPSEYDQMTPAEVAAFVRAFNEINKK